MANKFLPIIIIGAVLFVILIAFISVIAALSGSGLSSGNVALIPVKGVITTETEDSLFSVGGASSTDIVESIAKADSNPRIKAIIFEINSPGGTAVASDEIAQAIKRTNKTTVAWVRDVGASGAYWVASSCDHVVANRMSIVGSIGVISSYLDFSGLMSDYNVTYQRLVAGKYKDVGSPYKPLTGEERDMLQEQLDAIHEIFIKEVAENRGMPLGRARELSTGEIFIGMQAKENGLVDELGGKAEALAYISRNSGISPKVVDYYERATIISLFSGVLAKNFGFSAIEPAPAAFSLT